MCLQVYIIRMFAISMYAWTERAERVRTPKFAVCTAPFLAQLIMSPHEEWG